MPHICLRPVRSVTGQAMLPQFRDPILPKSELKRIKPELIEKYWPKKDEQK